MKRTILTTAVLLVAILAQAQTKISAKLENGFKAVYSDVSTLSMAGAEVKVTTETEYVVSDVTADGAIITATNTNVTAEAGQGLPMADMLTASQTIMKGVAVKFKTDADGKVIGVANLDEVKENAAKAAKAVVDKILENNPDLAQMMPRDALENQLAQSVSEKAIVASATNAGVLALNGKTISNGATESTENGDGMKLKSMYFLAGKNIIVNTSLDMTKDELKAFIIKQVEESAPEQAELIKQNIDMMIGQMKFEVNSKTTYSLQDNGWAATVKTEGTQDIMGQSQKSTSVITLKK